MTWMNEQSELVLLGLKKIDLNASKSMSSFVEPKQDSPEKRSRALRSVFVPKRKNSRHSKGE